MIGTGWEHQLMGFKSGTSRRTPGRVTESIIGPFALPDKETAAN
jgi:hypothetical protein